MLIGYNDDVLKSFYNRFFILFLTIQAQLHLDDSLQTDQVIYFESRLPWTLHATTLATWNQQ